jgi:tRNA A37 threonylcarbamoyltransferase TsaD
LFHKTNDGSLGEQKHGRAHRRTVHNYFPSITRALQQPRLNPNKIKKNIAATQKPTLLCEYSVGKKAAELGKIGKRTEDKKRNMKQTTWPS